MNLLDEIRKSLPLSVVPLPDLITSYKAQGLKVSLEENYKVIDAMDSGPEMEGILCVVRDARETFISPLVFRYYSAPMQNLA